MNMTVHVEHAGRKYWLQSSGRYFQSGVKTDQERLLHRRIWADANGPIPPEHDVHHIDGDWRNNALENLECVPRADHRREHMLARNATPEGRAKTVAALDAGREAARAWHGSGTGREWHRQHAAAAWIGRKPVACVCKACGAAFETTNPTGATYCSSACLQRVAFRTYFDDERSCAHCGNAFMANRHRATRFCSRTCSNRSRRPI